MGRKDIGGFVPLNATSQGRRSMRKVSRARAGLSAMSSESAS